MDAEKILLLVAAADGADLDQLAATLADQGTGAVGGLGAGATAKVARPVPARPDVTPDEGTYELVLQRGLSNGVIPGGFDAVLELTVPGGAPDGTGAVLAGVVDALGDLVDAERSAVAAGTVHVIMEGTGDVQLYYCMRRLPDVTPETFSQYWREQHAEVGKVTPGLAGYHQLHADGPTSRALAAEAGVGVDDIDGVALEWFDEMADFITAAGSPPSHAVKAKDSEGNFNDIDRATAVITTFEEVARG